MSSRSPIEWLEGGASWNFLYGCTKVAAGCRYCYAERVVPRLGMGAVGPLVRTINGPGQPAHGATYHGNVIFREDHLDLPLHWRVPRKIFVNSLSDTIHEDVPDSLLDRAFSIMVRANQHTYILLTKRPGRMRRYFEGCERGAVDTGKHFPWPHVWAGMSASDQATLLAGLPQLEDTPLAKRILSLEPLLGPIDVAPHLTGIGWVIVGGESGRLARSLKEQWVRDIVRACREAGVPVFTKQLGTVWAQENVHHRPSQASTKGNEPFFWPEDLRVREVPRG